MMGLIIAGAIIGFFALILLLPIHVRIKATESVNVSLRVLFVRIALFPKKHKPSRKSKKAARKAAKKAKKKAKKKAEKVKKKPKSTTWREKKQNISHMIRLVLKITQAVVRKLSRHLRIRVWRYEIAVGSENAAKTALLYGTVSGASATLFELFSSVANFKVKRSADVRVFADFTSEKTRAALDIDLSVCLAGVLATLFAAGLAFVKQKDQNI